VHTCNPSTREAGQEGQSSRPACTMRPYLRERPTETERQRQGDRDRERKREREMAIFWFLTTLLHPCCWGSLCVFTELQWGVKPGLALTSPKEANGRVIGGLSAVCHMFSEAPVREPYLRHALTFISPHLLHSQHMLAQKDTLPGRGWSRGSHKSASDPPFAWLRAALTLSHSQFPHSQAEPLKRS
jgi:hypothetical protein